MAYERILRGREGEVLFLLGNEAFARGALEGGVSVAATYPGTPSSEIGEVLFELAEAAGMYFEYSTNEKVAVEVAYAAATSGLRSLAFMKHVGLNVAMDSFISAVLMGVEGGMAVISADDPSAHSSQNEQDNRTYSLLTGVPMLEPSDPQEAKDMLVDALRMSEEHGVPFLIRSVTRVSHMRAPVRLGPLAEIRPPGSGEFRGGPGSHVPVPPRNLKWHEELLAKLSSLVPVSERSGWNRVEGSGDLGIVTSGAAYNYVHDVVSEQGIEAEILKLGMTNPLPRSLIASFLDRHDVVYVFEEVDPFLERGIREIAQMEGIDVEIRGKLSGHVPWVRETDMDVVTRSLGLELPGVPEVRVEIPRRPPVFCPGCPHRGTFWALRKAILSLRGKVKVPAVTTDIGCYTLGFNPPFGLGDVLLSMGASLGLAGGFEVASGGKPVALIGDSTFFHAGIPALINLASNDHDALVVILDNGTTAMTGHQPHPGQSATGRSISIEEVVRSITGNVRVVDPYDLEQTTGAFKEALQEPGLSVVVSRRACSLMEDTLKRRRGEPIEHYRVIADRCTACGICYRFFSCPAIYAGEDGKARIDPFLCDGCGVCAQVCPFDAIVKGGD